MKRRVAKLVGKKVFDIFEEKIPELKEHEMLIEMISVGLCHSDIPVYFGTSCMGVHKNGYEAMVKELVYPMELGHEPVGRVIRTGKKVTRFQEGDLVTGVAAGCFATHMIASENDRWIVIPSMKRPIESCLGEPMMCVANIVQAAAPRLGERVAVVGCGFMGLMCIAGLKAENLGQLTAIDFIDNKLELAKKYGATHTINPSREELEDAMYKLTNGRGFDIVIEITGSLKGLNSALSIVKIAGRGKICAPSMYTRGEIFTEEMAYYMMYRSPIIHVTHPWYCEDYMQTLEQGVEAYQKGIFPADELITHRIPFDRIEEGFQLLEHNPADYVKGIITFS
jgi:threonine dehydrogenase-like Zn-dependent dehydrogenase